MNKIKKAMLITVIIIIIIIIILISILLMNKKEEEKEIIGTGDIGEVIDYDKTQVKQVEDQIKFFTVVNCVNQYLDQININDSKYYGYDENNNYVMVIEEDTIKKNIYNLLSEEYIEKNQVTLNNLYDYIDEVKENVIFVPLKMNVLEKENVEKYIVYGIEQNLTNEYIKDIYLIVNLDVANKTFSIEPINQQYKDINDIQITNDDIQIMQNDNNSFTYEKISYEYTVKKYMDYYKKLALIKPELVYNYMDEEYRNKRFGSLENYEKYIEKNKQEITSLQGTKYLVNNYDTYTQYVCQDKYENSYIFNEKAPMDFTLQLDTYTIPTEKFTTTYNSSDNQKKVMMNVDKWVQMLNNRDYTSAYNLLDETYRNNAFGSEEQFETTMREKLPLHYKVEYSNFSEENETYMIDITLTDITEEEEGSVQISVIMQLKEDLDFVMSFSFQE